jgi:fatty acid desaturase
MDSRAAIAAEPAGCVAAPVRRPMKREAIDARANLTLIVAVSLALAAELAGLPFLLRTWGVLSLCLIVPIVVLTPTHWGLIHEAIHGQLFANRRLNERVARTLAIALALPFDVVRFGHLMHHRFTREPYDRPDVHDDRKGPRWRARIRYYLRLLGGLYLGELALPLVAFLPAKTTRALVARAIGQEGPVGADVQRLFTGFATDAVRRRRTRRDWLLTVALYAFAFYLYGIWWPALVATMYLRGTWLSLADNLPHYDVASDEPGRARNFRVARGWQRILMSHHLHRMHHQHPTLPWTALSTLARTTVTPANEAHEDGYFRRAMRQFSGPVSGHGAR